MDRHQRQRALKNTHGLEPQQRRGATDRKRPRQPPHSDPTLLHIVRCTKNLLVRARRQAGGGRDEESVQEKQRARRGREANALRAREVLLLCACARDNTPSSHRCPGVWWWRSPWIGEFRHGYERLFLPLQGCRRSDDRVLLPARKNQRRPAQTDAALALALAAGQQLQLGLGAKPPARAGCRPKRGE